jgi:hypothetical protein
MATDDPLSPLRFEAAEAPTDKDAAAAEKESLKFPGRFLKKAQELKDLRQELRQAWEQNEKLSSRLNGFVIRNLIGVLDNCKLALARPAPPAPEAAPLEEAAPAAEPVPAVEDAERLEQASLASVVRSVLYILEELGARRVELLGRTYDGVEVDGQKIDDPFDVLESSQKGKASEITVREVVGDLWVLKRNGYFEVLQRGRVNC